MTRTHAILAGLTLPVGALVAWALIPYASVLALGACALLGLGGLAGVRIVFAEGRRRAALAQQAELAVLQTGAPVHVSDVRAHGARWADRAQLSAHQVALAERHAAPAYTIIDAPAIVTPPLLPDSGVPTINLAQARAQGLSHAGQWVVGQGDSAAATIPLEHTGFVAVGGDSGTGKSNTAAWLAAQVAAAGGYLFVADPHYGDPESLSAALLPFSGAVEKFATTPEETNALIARVWRIYDARSKDPRQASTPVVLLVDEFLEQVLRQQITADAWAALQILAAGGRKKRMHGVLLSASWGAQALGQRSQPLRQMATHAIVHACAPEAARFLAPGQTVPTLGLGQALYIPKLGAAVLVRVPRLSSADQVTAAAGTTRPARPYTPWGVAPTVRASNAATVRPPPPVVAPTNQQRIVQLLADATWRTNREIAAALGVDVDVIGTETLEMWKRNQIARRPCKRGRDKYEYGQPTTQPTT